MFKKLRNIARTGAAGVIIHGIIRLYCATFRLKVENEAEWLNYLEQGGKVLLCGWHQQFFAAIRHFKTYQSLSPSLMISKSKDGEIIAGVAERSGWKTVRGSSSKDGRKALGMMINNLKKFRIYVELC